MTAPKELSPAPALASGTDRAEGRTNTCLSIPKSSSTEADFAARVIARRHRLSLAIARTVCALATIGRVSA
jgi:hypothetical protein